MDYSKFKTPYFEIEVGDSEWKTLVKLPQKIIRLISKVEVTEAFYASDNGSGGQIVLTITEGLGEKSGFLTDLVFDGKNGITTLTEEQNVSTKSIPKFLFQEKNKLKVTWGYLEDKSNSRSSIKIISQVQTTFPETGIPTTTITCTDFSLTSDQFSTKTTKTFAKRQVVSQNGNSLVIFNDPTTKELLEQIAKDLNIKPIISEFLPYNEIADKDKQKMWLSGESFHQFMTRLATLSGCVYSLDTDPKTGQETLTFMTKKDYEKRLVLPDKNLLKWKSPGSIIKDLRVAAEFRGFQGNSQKGIDKEGNITEGDSQVSESLFTQYKSSKNGKPQQLIDSSPVGSNALPSAKAIQEKIANDGVIGTVEVNPAISKKNLSDKAEIKTDIQRPLVQLDFTTIGYPKLAPGVAEISGIGVRYSGKYRLLTVVHSIDANGGYVTKCMASSQAISAGGVEPENPNKGEDTDIMVNERLFEQASTDTLSKLRKFQGLA